ncbi:hypothetical protein PR202_ga24702 [Eleusine coracana subsp. coracana]|uniref:At1g61320/AtMIF1 LRR domain-containing protein n=1 Tax=Eleusine coracana subsp. coracana TaxID=191504 RepID=A0AAV5DA86_ELECO|nr:hypothetical protein PR202_ga24702 [Eleusine coracana subsp. coracana]
MPRIKKFRRSGWDAVYKARTDELLSTMPYLRNSYHLVQRDSYSVFTDPSSLGLGTIADNKHFAHDKLKHIQIINFTSSKRLVELACHILESAASLQRNVGHHA